MIKDVYVLRLNC